MPRIYLTFSTTARANYYGERALAALRRLGDVTVNPLDRALDTAELIDAAHGCAIIVADRETPGTVELFRRSPDLVAFTRCAVDIRNVDVAAASECGVLVTRAGPGFVTSVAEWVIGVMIDLSRGITDAALAYRAGIMLQPSMGRELRNSTVGVIGYGSIGRYLLGGAILHQTAGWRFPLSTFCINVLGCFTLGALAGLAERHVVLTADARLFLFTGLLGGFTTFSALSFQPFTIVPRLPFSS